MKVRELPLTIERQYKNNGQHLEQLYRYNLTGKIMKADHNEGTDLNNIQIKSSKSSICKGTDFRTFIANDVATVYAYVVLDGSKAYEMDKAEYTEFIANFAYPTFESTQNNGSAKMKLREESKKMLKWLAER